MGFKGAKPFCESLSTFFSEESRGPSRPERQVKSILRGKSEAGKGERPERKAVHTRRTAGKAQKRQSNTQAGKQRHRMRAHLRETSRTAAGRRHLPAPGAASQTGQTAAEKALHTQSARRANGKLAKRKSGNQTRRQGNNATECGQRKAAEGRHDCGKPHAQPPGGGTSLHPGAASQTGQTAAAKAPHTQAHGRQTAGIAGQTKPDTKAAGCPQARNKAAAHRQKNAGAPGAKVLTTAAGFAKTAAPAGGAAHWTQKNPSEQAKFAFALSPARRGLVNRGRQKIASLFLAGTVFFCFAMRAAQNKRGRRPLLSPASFLKKA